MKVQEKHERWCLRVGGSRNHYCMDCSLVVHLIRHGESAANAGQTSDDPASIPLTEFGLSQADYLSSTLSPPIESLFHRTFAPSRRLPR